MKHHPLKKPLRARPSLFALAAAGLFALSSQPLLAATIEVDGVTCKLAGAILNANTDSPGNGCATGSGADTLVLPIGSTQTLNTALPDIVSDISIEGRGSTVKRAADAPAFRIFRVAPAAVLSLNQLTVSNGFLTSGSGGGIDNEGTLKLSNCTVSSNVAQSRGGGIQNSFGASLSVRSSTISGNSASAHGGGIANVDSTVSVANSTLSGNQAGFTGGGLASIGNVAVASITDSTITGNTAFEGGGVSALSTASISIKRSIVSGNSAASTAAEIRAEGLDDGYNFLGHSGLSNAEAFEFFTPGLFDFFGTSDGNTPTALDDLLDTMLADNGGLTQTHALVPGSPVIDALIQQFVQCGPESRDQRGATRGLPIDCDIGAVEFHGTPPLLVASLTLTPGQAQRLTLENQCVIVTARDFSNAPVANVEVDFVRTGANPGGSQDLPTNNAGQAQHCWNGVNGGVDKVMASFKDLISNESVITWNKRITSITPEAVTVTLALGQQLIKLAPTATLKDTNGNVPIAGRTVQFSAGATPLCSAVTNASGVAKCNATLGSILGSLLSLGYTAKFAGDTTYLLVEKKGPPLIIKLGL